MGAILGMGFQGSGSIGGVDGVCGIFAYKDSAWMAREAERILCAARICACDLYLAWRELFATRAPFICRRVSSRINLKKEEGASGSLFFFLLMAGDISKGLITTTALNPKMIKTQEFYYNIEIGSDNRYYDL